MLHCPIFKTNGLGDAKFYPIILLSLFLTVNIIIIVVTRMFSMCTVIIVLVVFSYQIIASAVDLPPFD